MVDLLQIDSSLTERHTMSTFHPRYGILLTSRETADQTGFSLNQLRYQRQNPEQAELSFLRQGGTSFYRQADVEEWLSNNGGTQEEYVIGGKATSSPLHNPTADRAQLIVLTELAKLTTKNAWGSHATWLIEQSGLQNVNAKVNEWAEHFWNLHREANPDAEEFVTLGMSRIDNPTQYWQAITWAVRRATAYVRGWDVSDQEIMDIPIGDNPPMKIV
jgi:hypothetical protein